MRASMKARAMYSRGGRLPAALVPLVQVRALRAERGVGPVPRVHPRAVRQPPEQLVADALEQRREPFRVLLRISHATWKQQRLLAVNIAILRDAGLAFRVVG